MKYFAAYRFLFENPDWPKLLLIAAVCQFVPIAGPLVLMGYLYSVVEAKHREGAQAFPMFNFDRLGEYLVRGVWPLVVTLVVILPVVFVMIATIMTVVFAGVLSSQGDEPPVFLIGIVVALFALFLLVQIALQFIVLPLSLRAGLSQDLRSAFSMAFVADFVGKVWPEMLLAFLVVLIATPILMIAGLLVFIVGIYVAAVIVTFAQFHLQYQLYELYLQRGGTPIPLKNGSLPH